MSIKKFIVIFLMLIFLGSFTGCKKTQVDVTEQEREKMNDVFYTLFSDYDINKIAENLNLINEKDGYIISYHSNNPDVISDEGVIYQGLDDKKATMTVTIRNEELDLSLSKTFVMTILAVSPIPIKDLYNASGIYKIKGIVSAIFRNVVYLEDSTGKTSVLLSRDKINKISEGSEVLITFDDSLEEKIIRFEVLSNDNSIAKSAQIDDFKDVERNYYRRVDVSGLTVEDVLFDPTNIESDIILTLTDGSYTKQLLVDGKSEKLQEEDRLLFYDLEIGDIVEIKNIISDDVLCYVSDSKIVRTKQVVISYTNVNDIDREGMFYLKGRVEYVLLNSFVIKDATGSRLIYNPSELPIVEGQVYSFRVDATFNEVIELTLKRSKELDEVLDISSDPIVVTDTLMELLKDNPLDNYLYVEMIGEVIDADIEKALVPYGTTDTYIIFNDNISSSFVGENVKVIGFLAKNQSDEFRMIVDKIYLAENTRINPIRIEISAKTNELNIYDELKLETIISPYYANYNNDVTFELNKKGVITIDGSGNVRAIGFGSVQVTAKTSNNVINHFVISVGNLDNKKTTSLLFGFDKIKLSVVDDIEFKPINLEHTYQYVYDTSLLFINNNRLKALDLGETIVKVIVDDAIEVEIEVEIIGDKNNGYEVIPDIKNNDVISVTSTEEFNDVLLLSYLNKYQRVNIRFDYDIESRNPVDLIDPRIYEVMLVSFNTYYIEKGHTIMVDFLSLDGLRGTVEEDFVRTNYPMLVNANILLSTIGNYGKRRSEDFDYFKIYDIATEIVNVKTSQELFVALEKGYLPNFNLYNSRAEFIFNQAKDILRQIITDDMDDVAKIKQIYDYIVLNVNLDKSLSQSSEKNLKANDLEGAFSGIATEEGIAKMFVVLCRIEGIKAKLVKGSNQSTKKYWNYVEIDNINYLVSIPDAITLSTIEGKVGEFYSRSVAFINYDMFLKETSILTKFYPIIPKYFDVYDNNNIQFLKFINIYNSNIDYEINSQEELDYLFSLIKSLGLKNDYYVYFSSKNFMITKDKIKQAFDNNGIVDDYYFVDYSIDNNKLYCIFVNASDN